MGGLGGPIPDKVGLGCSRKTLDHEVGRKPVSPLPL